MRKQTRALTTWCATANPSWRRTSAVCVALDRKDYPNSTILVAGVGRIQTDSYLKIRNAGDQMCAVVREVCTAEFNSDDCMAARALWRQK